MKNNGSEGGREDVEPLAGSILLESRSDGGIGRGGEVVIGRTERRRMLGHLGN